MEWTDFIFLMIKKNQNNIRTDITKFLKKNLNRLQKKNRRLSIYAGTLTEQTNLLNPASPIPHRYKMIGDLDAMH